METSSTVSQQRELILFGASGQLGAAIDRRISQRQPEWRIRRVRWRDVGSRDILADPVKLRDLVLGPQPDPAVRRDLLFASGVLDPKHPAESLRFSNLDFPRRVIELAQYWPGSPRCLTVGSVMESFPELCAGNPYLASKLELGQWVASEPFGPGRLLHVRVHTLYGGQPKHHMFLGQMIQALRKQEPFEMTSGDQLREYHHVEDLAFSFDALLNLDWGPGRIGPVVEISSGKPVRLADLAQAVFEACGRPDLLRLGAKARPGAENRERVFAPSPPWLLPVSRDSIQGVVELIRRQLE